MLKHLDLFSGYTITDEGRVFNRHGKEIKQQLSNAGYLRVELWHNGKGKKYAVHRLVALFFIPNPDDKPHVNHIEWTTRSENQIHAYKIGLQKGYKKPTPLTPEHKKKLCGSRWKKETHIYNLDGEVFNNLWDASKRFSVSRQTVLNRCKSDNWLQWTKSIERRS